MDRHVRLNMIVRNESEVIEGALDSAKLLIDSFMIVDTGSNDDTVEKINAWSIANGIAGKVLHRPWVDFGTNRAEALSLAVDDGAATHVLFLDADDRFELMGEPIVKVGITYQIPQQSGPSKYYLPNLIDVTRAEWTWCEPLHEYLVVVRGEPIYERAEWIRTIKNPVCGARSKKRSQKEKYLSDADVFRKRLQESPNNTRAMYYLANSLRDAGEDVQALEAYRIRINAGGWDQETYCAMLDLALCCERLNRVEEALGVLFAAWSFRPARKDALYHLVRILRALGRYHPGWHIAQIAQKLPKETDDILFVNAGAYGFRMLDEQAVCAYYCDRFVECLELSLQALDLLPPGAPDAERLLQNASFAKDRLLELAHRPAALKRQVAASAVRNKKERDEITVTFTSATTPDQFQQTVDSFLQCFEDLELLDRWIFVGNGSQLREFSHLKYEYPMFEWHCIEGGDEFNHASRMNFLLENVESKYWLHIDGNWDFFLSGYHLHHALEILTERPDVSQVLFNRNYAKDLRGMLLPAGPPKATIDGNLYWDREYSKKVDAQYEHLSSEPLVEKAPKAGWPHFSLQPSLMRKSDFRLLGCFDEHSVDFELDYARKYAESGYQSAFANRIICLERQPLL